MTIINISRILTEKIDTLTHKGKLINKRYVDPDKNQREMLEINIMETHIKGVLDGFINNAI